VLVIEGRHDGPPKEALASPMLPSEAVQGEERWVAEESGLFVENPVQSLPGALDVFFHGLSGSLRGSRPDRSRNREMLVESRRFCSLELIGLRIPDSNESLNRLGKG
jgi:hypothetical protein